MSTVFGMIRTMSAVPRVHLASPMDNAREISHMLQTADEQHADLCVFPELCLCGYTCGDLLIHPPLLDGCRQALEMLLAAPVHTRSSSGFRLKSADGCITAPLPSAAGASSASFRRSICPTAANSTNAAGSSRVIPRPIRSSSADRVSPSGRISCLTAAASRSAWKSARICGCPRRRPRPSAWAAHCSSPTLPHPTSWSPSTATAVS